MIFRARCLLPIKDAPVDNGAVVVKESCVKWLGRWRECPVSPGEKVVDLGEVALMPGLINGHCHLDYTKMAGQIPPPKLFPDWVKTILSFKAHWSFSEFAESWLAGARMLLEHGVTTVVDIESVPELPPEVWKATPLRVISLYEMTGVRSQRPPAEIIAEALEWLEDLPPIAGKEAGLSPHALYSTTPELIRASVAAIREKQLLSSTHLAESESEFKMFRQADGPFYEWLKGQRKMDDCGKLSPIQLADSHGLLGPRFLAVHVNYLAPGDAELLARSGASVMHCPRSHDYFGHDPFPCDELTRAGVNICLGTDSLASARKVANQSPRLDLWDEMRLFASKHPGVAPREILEMTTTRAAKALGKSKEIGSLQADGYADCIAVTYAGRMQEPGIYEELLYTGRVRDVIIGGENVRGEQ